MDSLDNPGVKRPVSSLQIPILTARTQVNQIKGNNIAGATGAGIPKHVTNVAVSMSPAGSVGAQSKVTVTFNTDPTDAAFQSCKLYVKGYQGNPAPVQISASGSPATLVLNNTGENVLVMAQASGNAGDAPLSSTPSRSIKLPKSSGGGYGTDSVTQIVNPPASTPQVGPRPSIANWRMAQLATYTGSVFSFSQFGTNVTNNDVGTSTLSIVSPTGTEPFLYKQATDGTSGHASYFYDQLKGITLNVFGYCEQRVAFYQNTSVRCWVGISDGNGFAPSTGYFMANTPTANLVGFRFSTSASDSHWMAYASPDGTNVTVVDTGVACDSSGASHLFALKQSTAGTIDYYIDGVKVASISSNLPTNTTKMYLVSGAEALSAHAVSMAQNSWYWDATK